MTETRKAVVITAEEKDSRVVPGTDGRYTVDRYVTRALSSAMTLFVSHLRGEMFATSNTKSDRAYYLLSGEAVFRFADGTEYNVKAGDAVFIPSGVAYKMTGGFDCVVVNAPALDAMAEVKLDNAFSKLGASVDV